MTVDAKIVAERELMSLTDIEKVSAFAALRSFDQDNFCAPCLETTAEHMAMVKRFLTENDIEPANCDVKRVLLLLNVDIHFYTKRSSASQMPV
jgi:hypothetical protein